ncbi:RNA polymerase sigma factor [Mangrovibacterium diazotrophicum]|uniref:RNA polymerase sigma factor n=1 Tax=Mangrovibacterium diazotrophicum TaxID=1261403 RepID=A0A419VW34_9BACT|nr:RNA polymerase sigma-70 factor [Mangrovibacterium diazotrophicum]RKD86379.1 RNA polymerase sigma-70 factor (ECF subfamily) [Mangrovibacterium diazotrophicum]
MRSNEHTLDYELVEKFCNGDIDAFDQIFSKYGDRLFGFALGYLKSKEETEELVQDVFLKIWENRKNLKKEASLKSYLFTIAYHNICLHFRKKRRHTRFLLEKSISENNIVDLEEQLEYRATIEELDKLIDKLPAKQKAIFIKSRKEGKSTREIAKEMNLAPGTVDNNISAAIKFLRQHISPNNLGMLLFFAIFITE